jgi:hypothetical protein
MLVLSIEILPKMFCIYLYWYGSGSPGVTGVFTLTLLDFNHCCRDIVLWEKPFFLGIYNKLLNK